MNNTNNCTCCFTDYIVKCEEEIVVNAQLIPTTAYTWVITDKFGRQYSGSATSDADGNSISIPITDLPAGLLTEFSGTFMLQFYLPSDVCAPVKFIIAEKVDCIMFDIKAGTRIKDNIGCRLPV